MDYFEAIKKHFDKNNFEKDQILKIIFTLGSVTKDETELTAEQASRYHLPAGTKLNAGICPARERIRTETYLLTVAFPFALQALAAQKIPSKIALIACANEDIFLGRDGKCYIRNALLCESNRPVREAWKDADHFALNWKEQENNPEYNFNLKKYFDITSMKGSLSADENMIIFAGVDPWRFDHKVNTLHALIAAEKAGATVLENPYYRIGEFGYKRHGFGDAKSMVKKLTPEFYPPSYENGGVEDAVQFLEKFEDVVIKPSGGSNGVGVSFFDIRKLKGKQRAEKMDVFRELFKKYKQIHQHPSRVIVQKHLRGIQKHGEIRLFIYDRKIMPVGIRLIPEKDSALCKIFMNASCEPVFLTEEYLRVGMRFIRAARDVKLKYFGLDVIKDRDADGKDALFVTEANTLISGFFDKIATFTDRNLEAMLKLVDSLPDDLRPFVASGYMNTMVYKQIYDHCIKLYGHKIPDFELLTDALSEAAEYYRTLPLKTQSIAALSAQNSKSVN